MFWNIPFGMVMHSKYGTRHGMLRCSIWNGVFLECIHGYQKFTAAWRQEALNNNKTVSAIDKTNITKFSDELKITNTELQRHNIQLWRQRLSDHRRVNDIPKASEPRGKIMEALATAMLKPLERKYLFGSAITCQVYQLDTVLHSRTAGELTWRIQHAVLC